MISFAYVLVEGLRRGALHSTCLGLIAGGGEILR